MKAEQEANKLFQRSKASKRQGEYHYRPGTTTVTYTPRVLASDAEQGLAAFLLKKTSQVNAARILGVGLQTVARAARAWYHRHPELWDKDK